MGKLIGENFTGIVRTFEAKVSYIDSVDPPLIGCNRIENGIFLLVGCAFGSVAFLASVVLRYLQHLCCPES